MCIRDSSNTDVICCLVNVYLGALYYTTGQYQTAIDHCKLVVTSQGVSQRSTDVVQGDILPKIDHKIDTVLGLAVFYQYVKTAALNKQQYSKHVSVFTTELLAYYLLVRCLSATNDRQTSLADEVKRYRRYFSNASQLFTTDVLLYVLISSSICLLYTSPSPRDS